MCKRMAFLLAPSLDWDRARNNTPKNYLSYSKGTPPTNIWVGAHLGLLGTVVAQELVRAQPGTAPVIPLCMHSEG